MWVWYVPKLDSDAHGYHWYWFYLIKIWVWHVPELDWDVHGYRWYWLIWSKCGYDMCQSWTQMFMDITGIDLFNLIVILTWIWSVIKASCLFCYYYMKCKTSSVKHDCPFSEVLQPITIMDLIGNWKFKYSHTNDLSPYMVVTWLNTTTLSEISREFDLTAFLNF